MCQNKEHGARRTNRGVDEEFGSEKFCSGRALLLPGKLMRLPPTVSQGNRSPLFAAGRCRRCDHRWCACVLGLALFEWRNTYLCQVFRVYPETVALIHLRSFIPIFVCIYLILWDVDIPAHHPCLFWFLWEIVGASRNSILGVFGIFLVKKLFQSVIGHGIGGKDIPTMARLAKGQTLK